MTDRFTELVSNIEQVSVGEEVLVKLESRVAGLPSGEIAGAVKEKVTLNGKNYLVVSGFGSVEVPAKAGKVSIKVHRAPAAAPAGGRRKSRRNKKSRSTRRRRV
jgi:hypothetical protein